MVIGSRGKVLDHLRAQSCIELEALFGTEVHLAFQVLVQSNESVEQQLEQ